MLGKSHTVQTPLVNLTVRARNVDRDEAAVMSLMSAVTDRKMLYYQLIL